MGLHSVEELVTGKRSEGKEAADFQGGVYEAVVDQEKRDDRRSHRELEVGGALEEGDSGGEQEEVSVAALNTDRSGRLKLETVDDLFNILQLRKRRRERKAPVHKKKEPEPESVPEFVDEQLFLSAVMENKLPVVEKYLTDGGNPNAADHFQRSALHKASFGGHVEVMKKLLEAGAAIEKKDKLEATAVHWACRGGNLPGLQLLLDQGAKFTSRDKHSSARGREDGTLRVRRVPDPLRRRRQRQRQRRRHADARRRENQQIQDDQAADDVRGEPRHQELRREDPDGDAVLVAERSQKPPVQLQRGENQTVEEQTVRERVREPPVVFNGRRYAAKHSGHSRSYILLLQGIEPTTPGGSFWDGERAADQQCEV